eukprot:Clim_evm72s243 gene=Clim_evmTU72s243
MAFWWRRYTIKAIRQKYSSREGERNEEYERHGFGKAVLPGGSDVYEGNYVNGKRYGKGTYSHKSTSAKYVSTWKEGRREGLGTRYTERYVFEGQWLNNQPLGTGKFVHAKGGYEEDGEYVALPDADPQSGMATEWIAREITSRALAFS